MYQYCEKNAESSNMRDFWKRKDTKASWGITNVILFFFFSSLPQSIHFLMIQLGNSSQLPFCAVDLGRKPKGCLFCSVLQRNDTNSQGYKDGISRSRSRAFEGSAGAHYHHPSCRHQTRRQLNRSSFQITEPCNLSFSGWVYYSFLYLKKPQVDPSPG